MSRLVSIVMATYKPNKNFLEAQLISINNQDYPNIEVLIRDDSADSVSYQLVCSLARNLLTDKSFSIEQNENNLGSNKTFEILTQSVNGDYIAYCDQDDVWEENKISILVNKLESENSVLCYSDLSIIDSRGNHIANSFKDINKRLKHVYGDNLFSFFLRRNSVTGCTMLIKAEIAKKSIPFCHEFYVHDHWLALCASSQGKISYVNEPLVKYRIHENNQIGASILKDIHTKSDYVNKKLVVETRKYNYLLTYYEFVFFKRKQIEELRDWSQNRMRLFNEISISNVFLFLKGFRIDYQLTIFEAIIKFLPEKVISLIFNRIKSTRGD
ncbi:glycosyltransferase [Paenibacillus sp. BSR1-1]|uniref:glycosyltransferase n=1 Tax=Paenibacillus sp. BSR1-1 TaxID=3020845 RepID=UPI0025B0D5E8|nr:glycosyltransferase [Paenibacillus sp. BSR1-1]MDN3019196.1 glycosyltransferase [Paenibacillus sp. BSR1-1]